MKRFWALRATVWLVALAGCSSAAQPAPAGSTSTAGAPSTAAERTLTVFAAASLKGAFTDLGDAFAAANPGVTVRFSFEGSSTLVDQLAGGAPADVFASADELNMTRAVDAGLVVGTPAIFAANVLTLVVAPGNPEGITGLDASLEGHKLVVCAVGVPCGNATKTLAENLGVTLTPVSQEQKVTDVLGKVTSGEADAGVVYTTDARSAGDKVTTVVIPGSDEVVNRYPIAVTTEASEAALAGSFIDFVTGDPGQQVLGDYGFAEAVIR
ncbi:MAG: molybdate ABC transporter substrate-binding protein [Propionibacteriaceae bacterium]|nr:molybdate ABC transporter substrate-binding protein [Propionibacteriaceae bacterium]